MIKLKQIIIKQGINDPNIFKAIFILGSPASGKSTLAKKILGRQKLKQHDVHNMYLSFSPTGLKYLNIDDVFQRLLLTTKSKTNFNQLTEEQYKQLISAPDSKYNRASRLTNIRRNNYVQARLGLIIDKTGANADKIADQVQQLQYLGYQCFCIYISSDLQEAITRNMNRLQRRLKEQDIVNC